MRRLVLGGAVAIGLFAVAASAAAPLDLNDPAVLHELERSSPAEFAKIELILDGLRARPERAETDWLQVTFHARDVDLLRDMYLTSLPPQQLLRFTLDHVRYSALITRSDLAARSVPAQATAPASRRAPQR